MLGLDPDEWSAIGSIVQAVATVAAFAAAGYAVWLEKRGERRRALADVRRQAEQIVVWPNSYDDASGERRYQTVVVLNKSDLPIFEFDISICRPGHQVVGIVEDVLPPGGQREVVLSEHVGRWESGAIWLRFMDSAGLRWARSARGRLEPSVNPSPAAIAEGAQVPRVRSLSGDT